MASATDKHKDSLKEYMKKIKNIKIGLSEEYLTYPFRNNDEKLIKDFYSFLDDMEVEIKEIDMRIAIKAAQIRAEYKFFKTGACF